MYANQISLFLVLFPGNNIYNDLILVNNRLVPSGKYDPHLVAAFIVGENDKVISWIRSSSRYNFIFTMER